jgi:hypothetical protein
MHPQMQAALSRRNQLNAIYTRIDQPAVGAMEQVLLLTGYVNLMLSFHCA